MQNLWFWDVKMINYQQKKHVNINKSAKKQQKKLSTSAKQNKMKNNYLRIVLR